MNCLLNDNDNKSWLAKAAEASTRNSIDYSNRRCNCKCTMKVIQMQQKRFSQQQKHSFKNKSNDLRKKILVGCRMQRRTSALRAAPAAIAIRNTIKRRPKTRAASPIQQPAITRVAVDTKRITETRDITTHCCCSKLTENKESSDRPTIVPPTSPATEELLRCDNLRLSIAATTGNPFQVPTSAAHLKTSTQAHSSGSNNNSLSASCSTNGQRNVIFGKLNALQIRQTRQRAISASSVAGSRKQSKVLLLYLLMVVFLRLTSTRKCYSFVFVWSLVCAQLLAQTPTARAQRVEIHSATALSTTQALDQYLADDTHEATAKHLVARDDAELAAKLQKLQRSSKKNFTEGKQQSRPLPTDGVSLLDGQSLVDLINRDNVLDRAHVSQLPVGTTTNHSPPNSGCQSCRMREKARLENLESIKEHILMRLKLSKMPNITTAIQVPQGIIENFYKIAYQKKLRPVISTSAGKQAAHVYNSRTADVMQGDDPQAAHSWQEYFDADADDQHFMSDDGKAEEEEEEDNEHEDNDFEDEFYSRVNSVYVFPTTPRIRHNRKNEILNFRLDWNDAIITQTIVNIYIRGYDWIREYKPALLEHYLHVNSRNEKQPEIVVTVHRVVRRPNATRITHTIKISETRHKVPNGQGQWVQIDVKQLPSVWTANRNVTLDIIIRGREPWMRPLIVTSSSSSVQNKVFRVFIEVFTKDERKTRRKRSNSLDCSERDNEVRCCRYPLRVNFTNFGWNWVVAPTSFNAYFCNGECKLGFLEKHAHTHLASLSTSAQPCCSPTKMSALRLLYFNSDQILVLSTIPNMSVEKCSCS